MTDEVTARLESHRNAGRMIDVEGIETFVLEEGSGDVPVVCVHGVPVSSFVWRRLSDELAARGMRSVAPDLPGLGLSARPVSFDYSWTGLGRHLEATLDALGVERMHLVVHDIGGPVGFELAARAPGRVASLTLLNTMVDVENFRKPWPMRPYAWPLLDRVWLQAARRGPAWRILARRTGVAARSEVGDVELAVHRALLFGSDDAQAFRKIMRGFETTPEKSALYSSVVADDRYPVQVLWGVGDVFLGLDSYGAVAARIAGINRPTALRGRHFVQEDSAAQIADRICALARPTPPVRTRAAAMDDLELRTLVEAWEQRLSIPARQEIVARTDLTTNDFAALNLVGDPLAENFILEKSRVGLKEVDDMEALAVLRDRGGPAAVDLWTAVSHVPRFLDFEEMRPAAGFVFRNAIPLAILQLGAFPFTYTSANVANVIDFSGRLGREGDLVRRYWETARATFAAYEVDAMRPAGDSWARWVKIRLMHSRVRMGISRSGDWDYRAGTPVSALNIAGGMYAFSSYLLHAGRTLGVTATPREAQALTRLWQWVAFLQGAPLELLQVDLDEQGASDRALIEFVYQPTDAARRLTEDWIEAAGTGMVGMPLPDWFVRAAVRRFLGASMQGIPGLAATVADDMQVPDSRLGAAVLLIVGTTNGAFDALLRTRAVQPRAERFGRQLMERSISMGLHEGEPTHDTPLG